MEAHDQPTSVTHRDSDFPHCSGTWHPNPQADNPEIRSFIGAYVEYSEHADSLMTPDVTSASEAYMLEREPEFEDLIESTDWALRDDDGVRDGILIPIFGVGGNTGNGGLLAAHEAGHMAIGVDVDQYLTYPEVKTSLLTSAAKNMDVAVADAVKQLRPFAK